MIFLKELLAFKSDFKVFIEINAKYEPVRATYRTLAIIAESSELCDLIREIGLKLEPSFHNCVKIFDKPVPNLKGIMETCQPMFTSFEQIRNFETFFETRIDNFFLIETFPFSEIYHYRLVFHYWLQGPNRRYMLRLHAYYAAVLQQSIIRRSRPKVQEFSH